MANQTDTEKTRRNCDDFLKTTKTVFTLARGFGIPTFGGKCALCWTALVFLLLVTIEVVSAWELGKFLTKYNTDRKVSLIERLSGSVFYGNAVLSLVLSWKTINAWKRLSLKWESIETKGPFLSPDVTISRRITIVGILIATCAFAEHTLSIISETDRYCPPDEYFKRYILVSHRFLLNPRDYQLWLGVAIFIVSNLATVLWNFQDIIVIVLSVGLTSRYRRLNSLVGQVVADEKRNRNKRKVCTEFVRHAVWRRIREAYVNQSALVSAVDKELGALILLSTLNNLFFICLKLYQGIRRDDSGLINRLYYTYSLAWLLLRASLVVLAAAEIDLESTKALSYIHTCPSAAYNVEVKRLRNQVKSGRVALSAKGLFYLNRQTLLQVVAAVIKYELILLEYDE